MPRGQRFLKACRKLMVGGAVMKINEGALPGRSACVLTDQARNAFGLAQTCTSPASIPQHSPDGANLRENWNSEDLEGPGGELGAPQENTSSGASSARAVRAKGAAQSLQGSKERWFNSTRNRLSSGEVGFL